MATNLNQKPFSLAETYNLKSQGYADLGDNVLANAFGDVANSLGSYSKYANSTLGAYDSLLNFMAGNEGKLQTAAGDLYNQLVNDINNQKTYVYDMFGPEGTLTKEVNKYYDDLGNYLATDAGRQAAIIAAQGQHSGASLGAIRAQQNEAYNESFARYVQAKEQQINAKQQIASNLINFMSTLRQEYGNTTNQYIIEMYKRAYDLYNNVALSVAQDMQSYNQLRFANSGSRGSSSNGTSSVELLPEGLSYNKNGEVVDIEGNKYQKNKNGVYVKISTPNVVGSEADSGGNNPSSVNESLDKVNNRNYAKNILNYAAHTLTALYPGSWAMLGALNSLKNRKTK